MPLFLFLFLKGSFYEDNFREAIQEAMSEEMRRDETVYLMGEVAEYNETKASKGMLDEFGAKRVIILYLS
jgi:pyruvate/2-oxoglutarate/acetoin dehydrogenase E1 component